MVLNDKSYTRKVNSRLLYKTTLLDHLQVDLGSIRAAKVRAADNALCACMCIHNCLHVCTSRLILFNPWTSLTQNSSKNLQSDMNSYIPFKKTYLPREALTCCYMHTPQKPSRSVDSRDVNDQDSPNILKRQLLERNRFTFAQACLAPFCF